MSRTHTSPFLVALIAATALLAAMAQYSRHDLGEPEHDQTHCFLCSHLGGTAGPPAPPAVPGRPVLGLAVLAAGHDFSLTARPSAGTSLPRGPPHSS